MISCLPLLFVVITVPLYAASTADTNISCSMDKEPLYQSICGRNVLLPVNGYNYELCSKGNAGGSCFSTLVLGLASKLTCKICMIRNEWSLLDDVMNITFTGEDRKIFLKFRHDEFNETCFRGGRLDVRLVEDKGYVKKWINNGSPSNVYHFKFALQPKCDEKTRRSGSKSMDSDTDILSIVILIFLITMFFVVSFVYCKRNRLYMKCWNYCKRNLPCMARWNQQNAPGVEEEEEEKEEEEEEEEEEEDIANPNENPANHQPPAGENHGSSTNDHDDIEDGSKSADNTALITTNTALITT